MSVSSSISGGFRVGIGRTCASLKAIRFSCKDGSHGYGGEHNGNAMPGKCCIYKVVAEITCESHTFGWWGWGIA